MTINNDTPMVDDLLSNMPDLDIDLSEGMPDLPIEDVIYIEGIDPRLKLLSHSSRSTLNKCPRKYQLYRLSSMMNEEDELTNAYQQLTFDYGTIVGMGIQGILNGESVDKLLLDAFMYWSGDILLRNNKQNKSFWEACLAIQQFESIVKDNGYLKDYELVEYNGKPAIELSFRIRLPNGFAYRGFIDAVLRHRVTGAIVVLEAKTTSYREVNSAQYKNSGQALGYSIILDTLFPELSSYNVLYLIYTTPNKEYIEMPFEKSRLQRALWLTELMIDKEKIELYEKFEVYPMNGDFCYDFYRECEYLGLCTLNTPRLTKPLTQSILNSLEEKEAGYDFDLDVKDLIQTQIDKNI